MKAKSAANTRPVKSAIATARQTVLATRPVPVVAANKKQEATPACCYMRVFQLAEHQITDFERSATRFAMRR